MARPRSFDEADVVALATEQFWGKGYAATTVDDLLDAMNLGKGSFYGAFGAKHTLFTRVFDAHGARLVEAARHVLEGPDEQALERIRSFLLGAAGLDNEALLHGCLVAKGIAELSESDSEIRAIGRRTFEAIEALLASTIAAAQRSGHVKADADPAMLAGLLLAVIRGMEALGKADFAAPSLQAIAVTAMSLLPSP
jgi:AcrR family transcriptional regulator